jgi:hypothetical protein
MTPQRPALSMCLVSRGDSNSGLDGDVLGCRARARCERLRMIDPFSALGVPLTCRDVASANGLLPHGGHPGEC